jgi:K+ transporter
VPLALGGHYLFHRLAEGGWAGILLALALVALIVFWPRIVAWIEQRWESRRR